MKTLSTSRTRTTVITLIPVLCWLRRVQAAAPADTGEQAPGTFWLAVQSIGALILVVVGIFVFVWLLKQMMTRFSGNAPAANHAGFQVVSRMSITPKQSLYAVRSFDDLLILASSDSGITLLHRYEKFEHWDNFDFQQKPVRDNFGGMFRKLLSRP